MIFPGHIEPHRVMKMLETGEDNCGYRGKTQHGIDVFDMGKLLQGKLIFSGILRTGLHGSMPNANQYPSKSKHWSEMPLNTDHCRSIPNQGIRKTLDLVLIDIDIGLTMPKKILVPHPDY